MKTGLLTITLIALIVSTPVIQAGWIECELLQIKNGRLYFSVGEDDLVFQHSKYAIICDDDTLATGRIEESMLGVCYSSLHDSLPVLADSCLTIVETAEVDSGAAVWLEFWSVHRQILQLVASTLDDAAPHDFGYRLRGSKGQLLGVYGRLRPGDYLPGVLGFTSDSRDPYITLGGTDAGKGHALCAISEAPFIAVMLPTLSRETNEGGIMTTSLYYRCSGLSLPHMFNGDGAQEVTSFLTVDEDAPRPFPINSSMGRKLLEQLPDHPVRLMIHPSEPCLIMTAEFIVDLLSRDKIRGQLTPGSENADIQIAFVPIDADVPWSTLRAVHDLLDENEPRTRSQREAMELVEAYINTAANSTDSATTVRFCKLAEQILIHDLGAFPLFRPTLYLYTSPSIIGLGFDENGRLDISNMVKLKLPSPSEGLEE